MNANPTDATQALKTVVKGGLTLVAGVAYFLITYATRIPDVIGGRGKQQAFALIMLCAIPAMILYFPVYWTLSSMLKRRLRR